jgi:mutator protein MutT
VLIAQRPAGKHMAGGWEFPGGKLEPGEERLAGLARELREELGIEMGIGPHRPLRRVRHSYADREILIEAWAVREYTGNPRGLDGQDIRWCLQQDLTGVPLLAADAPIVDALQLPECLVRESTSTYVIGPRTPGKLAGAICSDAEAALAAADIGTDFVAMRASMPHEELSDLCRVISVPVFACGIALETAWILGATGISRLISV